MGVKEKRRVLTETLLKLIQMEMQHIPNPGTTFIMMKTSNSHINVFEVTRQESGAYKYTCVSPHRLIQSLDGDISEQHSCILEENLPLAEIVSCKSFIHSHFNLSPREKDVLVLLIKGHSYKMISCSLYISIETVRSHLKNVYRKLGVNSKGEAINKALKNYGLELLA